MPAATSDGFLFLITSLDFLCKLVGESGDGSFLGLDCGPLNRDGNILLFSLFFSFLELTLLAVFSQISNVQEECGLCNFSFSCSGVWKLS